MLYEHVDQNREGDHICYISGLSKMKAHYPNWDITQSLDDTIGQIVANLVGNAVQHGAAGADVVVSVRGERSHVVLATENAAPRIAPESMATLFRPFKGGPRSAGGRNLGLGLYIVYQIVKAHRGTVECETGRNDETIFRVMLPRSAE